MSTKLSYCSSVWITFYTISIGHIVSFSSFVYYIVSHAVSYTTSFYYEMFKGYNIDQKWKKPNYLKILKKITHFRRIRQLICIMYASLLSCYRRDAYKRFVSTHYAKPMIESYNNFQNYLKNITLCQLLWKRFKIKYLSCRWYNGFLFSI